MRLGTLEAGGTKMVLSVGNENNELLEQTSIPTETPAKTIPAMVEWFKSKDIIALGIGSFGPVDLNPKSQTYGYITSTPKQGWTNQPLLPTLQESLHVPAMIDTDVNAAALAEWKLGAAKGLNSCMYVTIGTGVGAGLVVEGHLVHGLLHPEMGHMLLQPAKNDPTPDGFCPFHKGCLEGLASGPAIAKRWGRKAYELPQDHETWELEAWYLAQMCMNAICILSPDKIILGGGVMQQKHLFPMIRKKTQELLNGYIRHQAILEKIDAYITEPGLGTKSGATGALLLAKQAAGIPEG
ncbi:MAG: ROK family protein [Clostridia bacterium]|nr:ROK family protein [Clostridia bacterium]